MRRIGWASRVARRNLRIAGCPLCTYYRESPDRELSTHIEDDHVLEDFGLLPEGERLRQ